MPFFMFCFVFVFKIKLDIWFEMAFEEAVHLSTIGNHLKERFVDTVVHNTGGSEA